MQKLAEICIRRPVFATMIVLTLVVLGAAGYMKLGVDRFPAVDVPVVRISARLPGASPAEMESLVCQPIEEAVNTIEGIDELRSVSGIGSAFIVVTFAGLEKVVVVENGKAVEKTVTTGRRGEDWIEIISGLNAGESVVLTPAGIRTGQPLTLDAKAR